MVIFTAFVLFSSLCIYVISVSDRKPVNAFVQNYRNRVSISGCASIEILIIHYVISQIISCLYYSPIVLLVTAFTRNI